MVYETVSREEQPIGGGRASPQTYFNSSTKLTNFLKEFPQKV